MVASCVTAAVSGVVMIEQAVAVRPSPVVFFVALLLALAAGMRIADGR